MRLQSQRRARRVLPKHHVLLTVLTCLSLTALTALLIAILYSYGVSEERRIHAEMVSNGILMDQKIAKIKGDQKLKLAKKSEAEAKEQQPAALAAIRLGSNVHVGGKCGVKDPGSITVVINKKHCFEPLSYAPADLLEIDGYLLRAEAARALKAMMAAADVEDASFSLVSAYRSYDDQATAYNNQVATDGNATLADAVSAHPGHSEHQTGLAIDLKADGCARTCFASSKSYTWLKNRAAAYGFIERYPENLTALTGYGPEPWHWRYVGRETAETMKQQGIETLEAYFGISGGDYR